MIARLQELQTCPLLSEVSSIDLRQLLSFSQIEKYPGGTLVCQKGDPCTSLFILLNGKCEARNASSDGKGENVELLNPGASFGGKELLNNEVYGSTICTLTDSVLLRAEGDKLLDLLQQQAGMEIHLDARPYAPGDDTEIVTETSAKWKLGELTFLHFLHARYESVIVHELARSLKEEMDYPVMMVQFSNCEGSISLEEESRKNLYYHRPFHYASHLESSPLGIPRLTVKISNSSFDVQSLAKFLNHLRGHFQCVLVQGSTEMPDDVISAFVRLAHTSVIFLGNRQEDLQQFRNLSEKAQVLTNTESRIVKPVFIRDDDEASFLEFNTSLPAESLFWVNRFNSLKTHIRRLSREIAKNRIGIVLSSGGAKGLAHIGVLQVLEENGIDVDVIAGSSMGAYVASVFAYGYNGEYMEQLARQVEHRWGLLQLIDPVLPIRQGFIQGTRVIKRLKKSIGDSHFCDLVTPLRIVATNLKTEDSYVFSEGEVASAVRASISVPGVCVPVMLHNHLFVDGGIRDPLPVDVLKGMGIEKIIAINTIPNPELIRQNALKRMKEEIGEENSTNLFQTLNQYVNYTAPGNILDILIQSTHCMQVSIAEISCKKADLVIRPVTCDGRWHDFTKPGKYIALGRQAALTHLSEIKALMQRRNRS